jgi:hypothetical protein
LTPRNWSSSSSGSTSSLVYPHLVPTSGSTVERVRQSGLKRPLDVREQILVADVPAKAGVVGFEGVRADIDAEGNGS